MTPERWEQIGRLYHAALELKSDQRAAFLDQACAGDQALRREVESLIAADEQAGDFIAAPALKDAAGLVTVEETALLKEQSLGHYQILSPLGSGGMGEVYLAKDSRLGREVALKTLPPVFASDANRLQRFQTEAKAAATLNHPNIATIYSVEEINGRHFITMEYVAGQPLDGLLPKAGLALEAFLEWFLPLADALAHAHEKGIIHRDIKPGNIMVTPHGVPKILDFGLARIDRTVAEITGESQTPRLTQEGQVLGTPAYMSPEQAEGKPVDHRSDIFSFGVVMYEALTGQRPFKGNSYASIVSELLKEEPPAVSELKPRTPFLLARLIQQCLRKDCRHRYQTMREVRTLLAEAQAEAEAGMVIAPSGAAVAGKPVIVSRPLLIGLMIVAALLAGLAIWSLLLSGQPEAKPITRFALSPPPGQQSSLSEAQLSPDGKHLVFASRRGGLTQLFLRPLDQFEARPIPGTDDARRPFFSPDGEWIGFFTGEDKLRKVPVAGGAPLTICDGCETAFETHWGVDDTIIVADTKGLYRIAAGGGKPERLTSVDEAKGEKTHRAPQLLPGGRGALFTVETTKGSRLAALSLATRQWRELAEAGEAAYGQYLATGHVVFARSKQLLAAPFDPAQLVITGPAVTVLDGVFAPSPNFRVAGNGTLVYLPDTAMQNNALVWVDRQGQATPLLENRANYRSPRLSPDGRRVAVQVDSEIWIYEVETGRGLRLTFEGDNQSPIWTPDGQRVVFASNRNGVWHLYQRAADLSSEAEKLISSEYRHLPYSWHPAGQLLALAAIYSTSNSDVLMWSAQNNKTAAFVSSPFIEDTPRFSPDGRWLAYFSIESGKVEVYVQPHPGPGGKVPISRGGGMFPVWSRDGRELFYRQGSRLYAVTVKTAPGFTAGAPRALFEGRYLTSYDVAPDGQRFVMVRNEQGSLPSQVYVVLNWTEELKRLMPAGN
jgi:Tol biopolymer transport system component/predicted Ser/Thr protein kinase